MKATLRHVFGTLVLTFLLLMYRDGRSVEAWLAVDSAAIHLRVLMCACHVAAPGSSRCSEQKLLGRRVVCAMITVTINPRLVRRVPLKGREG